MSLLDLCLGGTEAKRVMEGSGEFMGVAVSVPRLLHKLWNLLNYEGIAYKRSNVPVREAMDSLDFISRRIIDAEERQITLNLVDSFWKDFLSRLNDLENVIDTIIARTELWKQNFWKKMMPSVIWFIHLCDQHALSKEMDTLKTYAEALSQQILPGPTGATSSHTQPRNVDYQAPDDSYLDILNDEVERLLKQLLEPKHGESDIVIAVTGAAGSGKTVTAKRVSNRKAAKRHFHHLAWVNGSGDFEPRDFLVDILKQLSQERFDENLQDNELESRLNRFSEENHCLIVVDDVPTSYDLDKLSVLLECIGGQSRLILTTCNQDVARAASKGRSPIWLRSLTNEESWTLFLKRVQIAEDSINSESSNLKEDILRKCDGLPRAILVLGGLLSGKVLSDWHSVIEKLSAMDVREWLTVMPAAQQDLSAADKKELSSVIHPRAQENILTLSFQDLSSQVKYCFLHTGLFPRAVEIPIRRLFHHWRTESLVPLPETHMPPEDPMRVLKQLISKNLIEVVKKKFDGSPKTCRMPGGLWDVFRPIAVSYNLYHVHNNTVYTSAESPQFNIRRLVEYAGISNYPSSDPHTASLRSFVSFNTQKRDLPNREIGIFLDNVVNGRGYGLLTLLDLELVCKPVLHKTIGKFLHLKYLGLRWTSLDSLPMSIGNLPYLEVLDVKHTNITALPSSFWNAKNLICLYLNSFDIFDRMPKSRSLPNLQSLSGLLIGNNSLVTNFLNKSPGLKILKLTCSSRSVGALADSISQLSGLQSLRLRSIDEDYQPSTLELGTMAELSKLSDLYLLGQLPRDHSFSPSLKVLTLSASELEQDPMPMLGQLCHLNALRLLGRSYVGKQMTCLPEGFPQLRILKLWMLENLEEWIVEEGAMPRLTEVEIRHCNRLQQPQGLQLIAPLKEVILTHMSDEFVANFRRIVVNASVCDHVPIDPLPVE